MRKLIVFFMVIFLTPLAQADEKLNIVTTIQPLAYFAEKVGGDLVNVKGMIPPGGNPHTYEPSPSEMMELSNADIYIKVGAAFEFEQEWIPKLEELNADMTMINASEGIHLMTVAKHDHGHDHHGGCGGGEGDPHIWVSVNNAMLIARTIQEELVDLDPSNADVYENNTNQFLADLGDLNYEIRTMLKPLTQRAFYIYHPSWGYFAQDYDLEQVVIEQEGKEPSAKDLMRLVKQAKEKGIKAIFISPEFSDKSARVIADEIDGDVVVIDHLGKQFMENMRQAATAIVEASDE